MSLSFHPRRVLTWSVAVLVGVATAGRVLARLLPRVTVAGESMQPALAPGDRLLLLPVPRVRPGDVVAVRDPREGRRLLVKRVTAVDRGRRLVSVEGDNRERSSDSRVFGPVRQGAIVGKAVYRYAPRARVGPVAGDR